MICRRTEMSEQVRISEYNVLQPGDTQCSDLRHGFFVFLLGFDVFVNENGDNDEGFE